MSESNRFLVIQTAFPGDVILTLPLIQALKRSRPDARIDVLVIPKASELLHHHPDIHEIICYDKKGRDAGLPAIARLAIELRGKGYGAAIIPHRSLRSAVLAAFARIPKRIGFDTSAGKFLMTDVVRYSRESHETVRNTSLLLPLGIRVDARELPKLYPSAEDTEAVQRVLSLENEKHAGEWIAIAPGSVWNTKRWLAEGFAGVAHHFAGKNYTVMLIGGKEDSEVCNTIRQSCPNGEIVNLAGKLSLLQSAEAIRMCKVLVTNDSAPMHLAAAMKTPVVAIFGATVPAFGFAPLGPHDVVVETAGLACRPCSIHGGDKCPIVTFDCMKNISVDRVAGIVSEVLRKSS